MAVCTCAWYDDKLAGQILVKNLHFQAEHIKNCSIRIQKLTVNMCGNASASASELVLPIVISSQCLEILTIPSQPLVYDHAMQENSAPDTLHCSSMKTEICSALEPTAELFETNLGSLRIRDRAATCLQTFLALTQGDLSFCSSFLGGRDQL